MMSIDIRQYREQIIAACPNRTGDWYFLEKGINLQRRLDVVAKKPVNCSDLGMVCLKGCPRVKFGELSFSMVETVTVGAKLTPGHVLYEVEDTSSKSKIKFDSILANLMVPVARSTSGPVKGTRSVQPEGKSTRQKRHSPGNILNPVRYRKLKNILVKSSQNGKRKAKKLKVSEGSIPNPILLLAAYTKHQKKRSKVNSEARISSVATQEAPILKGSSDIDEEIAKSKQDRDGGSIVIFPLVEQDIAESSLNNGRRMAKPKVPGYEACLIQEEEKTKLFTPDLNGGSIGFKSELKANLDRKADKT